jgi:hypothetical protein
VPTIRIDMARHGSCIAEMYIHTAVYYVVISSGRIRSIVPLAAARPRAIYFEQYLRLRFIHLEYTMLADKTVSQTVDRAQKNSFMRKVVVSQRAGLPIFLTDGRNLCSLSRLGMIWKK